MKVPKVLDEIADTVLRYRPKPKSKAAKKRRRKEKRIGKSGENQADGPPDSG